jgi:hypothetical protein
MRRLLIGLMVGLLLGCGGGDDGGGNDSPPATVTVTLDFLRAATDGLDPFKVTATIMRNGAPVTGIIPMVSISEGSIGAITELGGGQYQFSVAPARTGEYEVTVSHDTGSATRTALVLQDVHPDWEQPMSVPGLVNTAGWEDGVTITPDGEYLFVQTGPYRASSFFVFHLSRASGGCGGNRLNPTRCDHPWINETMGTYTAPERPGFFHSRFSGTTQLHNAASWGLGVDEVPTFTISTMFYGFKRQSDSSFREPFFMVFDDLDDGIIGPYGLSFRMNADGTSTIIFTLQDAFTTDAGFDIYTLTEYLGSDIILGEYEFRSVGNPPDRGSFFPSTLVDLGDNSGTQGNPFLYHDTDGAIRSIWTDDEYDGDADTKKLTVYVLASGTFPDSGAWTKVQLPSTINQTDTEAIQPTFADGGLFFTRDISVVFSAYSGAHTAADFGNNANWATPSVILQKDTTIGSLYVTSADIGKIIAIGEPTVATVNGTVLLYFVYGTIRGIDAITGLADIDMQAGFVAKR